MNGNLPFNITKVKAELCRRKLSFFVKEFWHIVVAEELIWEPHMDAVCDEIQQVYERVIKREPSLYDLIINIPPGTSKSTLVTIMAPAWSWTRDPSLRHISGSYSDSLATEHAVKSRDIVESDLYKLYFPEVLIKPDKGRKTNYETIQLGQRYATSVGGTITGIHGHILTIDDPINPKQAASPVFCQTANNWIDKTLSMRKVNKEVSAIILLMQRLSTNDPTGYLLEKKNKNIKHVCLPAILSDDVKPIELKRIYQNGLLSPIRLSAKAIEDARADLLEDGFAGQMQQRPVKEGGLIWTKCFREIDDNIFPRTSDMKNLGNDWDLAYTSDDMNAASAYVSSGKIDGNIFIFDIDFRYLEFPELVEWMATKKHMHFIEDKGPGKSAKQTLSRNGIVAMEVKVPGGADKISRAKQASAFAKSGIVFIKKSLADKLYNDSQQGILNFPKSPKKDVADALAQAILRQASKPLVTSSGRKSILDAIKK